jgi:hypothetical protein
MTMKKSYILSTAVALALLASTTPASALNVGATVNGNASVSSDRFETTVTSDTKASVSGKYDDKNRDDKDNNRGEMNSFMNANMGYWKNWMFNTGITGTVTTTSNNSITVKGTNGTVYTVNTADANIRYAKGSDSIKTGDHVYIQGAVNGTSVVATLIVDAKTGTATPTNDEKRSAVVGTVTAKSGNSITVAGKNGTTYTVAAANASIWKTGHQSSSVSDISIGDAVVVHGTVNGSSVTATKIMAITFPETSANGGIRGTVTAVKDDTITIMVAGGATYSVDTDDATFTDRKGKTENLDDVKVGEMIVVKGDVNGSTITADSVSEAKVNQGFFARLGGFFKHMFGKKSDSDK